MGKIVKNSLNYHHAITLVKELFGRRKGIKDRVGSSCCKWMKKDYRKLRMVIPKLKNCSTFYSSLLGLGLNFADKVHNKVCEGPRLVTFLTVMVEIDLYALTTGEGIWALVTAQQPRPCDGSFDIKTELTWNTYERILRLTWRSWWPPRPSRRSRRSFSASSWPSGGLDRRPHPLQSRKSLRHFAKTK